MPENTDRFTEVGDRVWVARYEWYDVNVTVVEGAAGLLVVDTHASSKQAREVIADLRRLSSRPVVGLVNTHDHVDHVFGNSAFQEEYGEIPITAHESAAETTVPHGEQKKLLMTANGDHRADGFGTAGRETTGCAVAAECGVAAGSEEARKRRWRPRRRNRRRWKDAIRCE